MARIDARTSRRVALLTIGVVLAAIVVTASAGFDPGSLVAPHDDGENNASLPGTDDYDDPIVDYDAIGYELTLNGTAESDLNYSLTIIGAVEPVGDAANGTVDCAEQVCRVEGALAPNETATYHVSGSIVGVQPKENLTGHVNGTFEGDALIGIGMGALSPDEAGEESDDQTDGNSSGATSDEDAVTTDDGDDSDDRAETDGGDVNANVAASAKTSTDADSSSESDADADAGDGGAEESGSDGGTDDGDSPNDYDCEDFETWAEADEVYDESDEHDLDDDDDGVPCEELTGAPGGTDGNATDGTVTDGNVTDGNATDGAGNESEDNETDDSNGDNETDRDGGNESDGTDEATADDISINYENCHTVSIDVAGDRDASDWEIWELSTRFFIEDGVDTMIIAPNDDLPATIDANERIDGAVTDVEIENVMLTNDSGSTFVEASQPDESCGEQINQQWQAYQNESGDGEDQASGEGDTNESADESGDADETGNEGDTGGDEETADTEQSESGSTDEQNGESDGTAVNESSGEASSGEEESTDESSSEESSDGGTDGNTPEPSAEGTDGNASA